MFLELLDLINKFLGQFLPFSIIIIPILYLYSKLKKDSLEPKLSLAILKWIYVFSAILQLSFWIKEFYLIYWEGNGDQLAYINEQTVFYSRALGEYWYFYWIMLFGNMIFPVFLLIPYFGRSFFWIFVFAFLFKVGMYLERWIIIFSSRHMGGINAQWIEEDGILISFWILQGVIYTMGLLVISYLILYIKKQYSK